MSEDLELEIVRAWCDAMSLGEGPDEGDMRRLLTHLRAARQDTEQLRIEHELLTQDNAIDAGPGVTAIAHVAPDASPEDLAAVSDIAKAAARMLNERSTDSPAEQLTLTDIRLLGATLDLWERGQTIPPSPFTFARLRKLLSAAERDLAQQGGS